MSKKLNTWKNYSDKKSYYETMIFMHGVNIDEPTNKKYNVFIKNSKETPFFSLLK